MPQVEAGTRGKPVLGINTMAMQETFGFNEWFRAQDGTPQGQGLADMVGSHVPLRCNFS